MSRLPTLAAVIAERMQLPTEISALTGDTFRDVFGPSTVAPPESLLLVGACIIVVLSAQVILALHLESRGNRSARPEAI